MDFINTSNLKEINCSKCKNNYNYVLVGIALNNNPIYLCDSCLQDLNREIVNYLASKYI